MGDETAPKGREEGFKELLAKLGEEIARNLVDLVKSALRAR